MGLSDAQSEWFYVVQFRMSDLWHGYTGTDGDTLRTRSRRGGWRRPVERRARR